AFIVDPPHGRAAADELVMVQNAFDPDFDDDNEVYAVNTVAFHFMHEPVRVRRDELVRIYLVNIVELDPINSFHVHANFFHRFPGARQLLPPLPDGDPPRADGVQGPRDPGPGPARRARAALSLHGPVHVPRPQDRVRCARLDGFLRGRRVKTPAVAVLLGVAL